MRAVTLLLLASCLILNITAEESIADAVKEVPQLPTASEGATPIPLGNTVRLSNLGPAIVNEDGTLRRITNWDELTEAERAVALRRIAERNKARLELLRQLKEVQKQEQLREERVQRILRQEVEDVQTPAASRLVSGGQRDTGHIDDDRPLSPSQLRSRRKRAQPLLQQREEQQYPGAHNQQGHSPHSGQEAHVVEVEVSWSDHNTTAEHTEL